MRKKALGASIESIVWQRALLSGRQLLALVVIAKGVDAEGGRWSGYVFNDLAIPARASRSQIESDLKLLVSNGFVRIERSEEFAHIWITNPDLWVNGEQSR